MADASTCEASCTTTGISTATLYPVDVNSYRHGPGRASSSLPVPHRDAEAMRIAVVVGHREFPLAIVALRDGGRLIAELEQAGTHRRQVLRRPVETDTLVILGLRGQTRASIEPECQVLVVHHAADQAAGAVAHFPVHGKPEPIYPESQASFEIRTRNDG